MNAKKRVVIFISGRGSNMEKLIEAAKHPKYSSEIIGVISNKADAKGIEFAKKQGIKTAIIASRQKDKKAVDLTIDKQLLEWDTDLICLAGYMRILGEDFCEKWEGKIINIHPSLLPQFKGLDTHQRAINAQNSEHGCTVHFVTAKMDDGPNIGQIAVPIKLSDTAQTLSERVLIAEHNLYPWALEQVASEQVTFEKK